MSFKAVLKNLFLTCPLFPSLIMAGMFVPIQSQKGLIMKVLPVPMSNCQTNHMYNQPKENVFLTLVWSIQYPQELFLVLVLNCKPLNLVRQCSRNTSVLLFLLIFYQNYLEELAQKFVFYGLIETYIYILLLTLCSEYCVVLVSVFTICLLLSEKGTDSSDRAALMKTFLELFQLRT